MGGSCCKENTPENSKAGSEAEMNGKCIRIYSNFEQECLSKTTATGIGPLPEVAELTNEKISYDNPFIKSALNTHGEF